MGKAIVVKMSSFVRFDRKVDFIKRGLMPPIKTIKGKGAEKVFYKRISDLAKE